MSDIFDKTDEKCPNRPENQELGPILGQNGDPDLIKLFPALPAPENPLENPKNLEKILSKLAGKLARKLAINSPMIYFKGPP